MDGLRRPIRHAGEFWDHYGVMAHVSEPGDLIFFSRSGEYPSHIGIVQDPETYIHAPGRDGSVVAIRGITRSAITPRQQLRRQLYAVNPIGFKSPTVAAADASYRHHQDIL